MNQALLKLSFIFSLLYHLVDASALGYDAILTIVVIEVIFSFSVGLVCIVLSFNLFRALKDSPDIYTGSPIDEFPLSRCPSQTNLTLTYDGINNMVSNPNILDGDYRTFHNARMTSFGSDAEMDYETLVEPDLPQENNLVGIVRSFAGYLRLW